MVDNNNYTLEYEKDDYLLILNGIVIGVSEDRDLQGLVTNMSKAHTEYMQTVDSDTDMYVALVTQVYNKRG